MTGIAATDGWRRVKLKDLCREITVGHVGPLAHEYVDDGIPFLRSQNIQPFTPGGRSAIRRAAAGIAGGARAQLEEIERAMEPLLAFQGQIRDEVTWYEGARRGTFDPVPLSQIGRLLIGLRIAHGLTQRQLAERLAVTEPVVSRDERNEYRGITIERVQRILDALNQAVSATVEAPAEWRTLAGVG